MAPTPAAAKAGKPASYPVETESDLESAIGLARTPGSAGVHQKAAAATGIDEQGSPGMGDSVKSGRKVISRSSTADEQYKNRQPAEGAPATEDAPTRHPQRARAAASSRPVSSRPSSPEAKRRRRQARAVQLAAPRSKEMAFREGSRPQARGPGQVQRRRGHQATEAGRRSEVGTAASQRACRTRGGSGGRFHGGTPPATRGGDPRSHPEAELQRAVRSRRFSTVQRRSALRSMQRQLRVSMRS